MRDRRWILLRNGVNFLSRRQWIIERRVNEKNKKIDSSKLENLVETLNQQRFNDYGIFNAIT